MTDRRQCPCGARMYVDHTNRDSGVIDRWWVCKTCGRRDVVTSQVEVVLGVRVISAGGRNLVDDAPNAREANALSA